MNIGDVYFALRGEGSGLSVDAKKAAEAAGATGAKSFRASFDAKLKGLGAAGVVAGAGVAAGMMAWNALGASVQGAVGFMQDAVGAAMEDEASQVKMRAALEANVKGWDGNTDAIEKVIKARMKLGFSDDEQRASLAVLVAKTGDVTSALAIQGAAMDLARLKGIDLAAASKAIALGMGGQGRALKELGINVKDYAGANEILAAIQAKAAGQAEAYGNTTAGAMAAAKVAIDEATEAIGYGLLPYVKQLAFFVRDEAAPAVIGLVDALGRLGANTKTEVDTIANAPRDFFDWLFHGDEALTLSSIRDATAGLGDLTVGTGAAALAEETMGINARAAARAAVEASVGTDAMAEATQRTLDWSVKARLELPGLAKAFRATAAAARASRLDEAWGIKELPDQIIVATEAVRQAGKDVTAADKAVADARVALAHATTATQKRAAQDALTAALAAAAASRIALDGAKQAVDGFNQKLADSATESGAAGVMIGKMLGWGIYKEVRAWGALTRRELATLGQVTIVNPRFTPTGGKHVGANAAGGPRAAGQIGWVGERGPELRVAASNDYILNNRDSALAVATAALGGGRGGPTYNVNVYNPEPRAAEPDVGRVLRRISAMGMS